MSDTISIQNEQGYTPVDVALLQRAIRLVLEQEGTNVQSGITVVLTDNATVQALNKQHRATDAPTDVLSFPADPLPPEIADEAAPYLGDLIIAFPYSKAQADRLKHDLRDSLVLLVIHGTLHLLGYDHDTPEHKAAMWAAQNKALTALGVDTSIVPALEHSEGSDHA